MQGFKFRKCKIALFSSLELPDMVKLCTVWWDKVNETIKSSLKSTFHYVQSVSSVASLVKPYLQVGGMVYWLLG